MPTSKRSDDEPSEASASTYGVRITHYRLFTQAAPGLLSLLMVLQSSLTPVNLQPFAASSQSSELAWAKLVGIGIPVLFLSLPAGFVLSGVSFFVLGLVVFPLRNAMWRCRPVLWLLAESVGEPRTGRGSADSAAWTRYISDIGFILRGHSFRGPREDAPDKVIAVAIFARSLALLVIVFLVFRRAGILGDSSAVDARLESALLAVFFVVMLLFASFFELYRDFTLVIAAEQFEDYQQFESSGSEEAMAITFAKKRLRPAEEER